MTANTHVADTNEILLAYYLSNKSWNLVQDREVTKKQLDAKKKIISQSEFEYSNTLADKMAKVSLQWAMSNGYKGKVKKVWWTARPGVLSKAVGVEVDSRKNPTDVLVQFTDNKFLGISAKATKGTADIGFKNPGLGTVEKGLNIKLKETIDSLEQKVVSKFKLPASKSERKIAIRKDKKIQEMTQKAGSEILAFIADMMFNKLKSMKQDSVKTYLLSNWMDSAEAMIPRYIKVTGTKNEARVEDPLNNSKLAAIQTEKIVFERVGNESIGVKTSSGKKLFKMRSKYESEKIASTIKFSGEPW